MTQGRSSLGPMFARGCDMLLLLFVHVIFVVYVSALRTTL